MSFSGLGPSMYDILEDVGRRLGLPSPREERKYRDYMIRKAEEDREFENRGKGDLYNVDCLDFPEDDK